MAGQIARGGIGSLTVKVANTVFGIALGIILARALGPEGYGTYAYVFALVAIMAIPAQFGLSNLVIRETARAHVKEQWGKMRYKTLTTFVLVRVHAVHRTLH